MRIAIERDHLNQESTVKNHSEKYRTIIMISVPVLKTRRENGLVKGKD